MLAYTGLIAQTKPCFKVYDVATKQEINIICAGQKIKVVNCQPVPPTTIQYYDFDARDGVAFAPNDTVNTHTFAASGSQVQTFRISFLPVDPNAPQSDSTSRAFRVLPRPSPQFRVEACTQRSVRVSITDQHYDMFTVDFGDGTTQQLPRGGTSRSHQYAPGQALRVRVTGHYNNAHCTETAEATAQELALPPLPRLARVQVPLPFAGGRIQLTLEDLRPEYYYLIERQTATSFLVTDTIKNPSTAQLLLDLSGIDATRPVCFRVRATDRCGTPLSIVSNSVCSLPVTIHGGQHIQLSWPPYPEPGQLTGYQLFKNGQPYRDLPKTQQSFTDEAVTCNQQYCYELVAQLSAGARSVSNNPCTAPNSGPAPGPASLSSTFTPENQIRLTALVAAGQVVSQVTFRKSVGGGAYSPLGTSPTTTMEDNTFNPDQGVCYQAVYQDSCAQTSPASNQTCPILLKAAQPDNNSILLTWSAYVGSGSGTVAYRLEKLDASGTVVSSIPVTGNTYTDVAGAGSQQKIFYRIQGLIAGQAPTFSNTERVTLETKAMIPNAFTPNGDNLNDVFEVKGRFIDPPRLTIYDRWGQILFQGQAWDGKINGKEAPTGTYPYGVTWKDEKGLVWSKKGMVSLLR
jgi:gliding motility-associated-like protein